MKCDNIRTIIILLNFIIGMPIFTLDHISYDIDSNYLNINEIPVRFLPYIEYYDSNHQVQSYELETYFYEDLNVMILTYYNDFIDIKMSISRNYEIIDNYIYKFEIIMNINNDILLRKYKFNMDFLDYVNIMMGYKAIEEEDSFYNINLLPFRMKSMKISLGNNSIYILGSNFKETTGIEILNDSGFFIYNNEYHTGNWRDEEIEMDWFPLSIGDSLETIFYISIDNIPNIKIHRYPFGKKAALCISSDADEENENRLKSVFWGTSNESSPCFGKKGLLYNNIKLCNTVFGANFQEMQNLETVWDSIFSAGNTIGYHTYYPWADDMGLLEFSLSHELVDYNIQMWIDHSLWNNPECLAREGWIQTSQYYVLDILNNNKFKYAWLCLNRENSFNSFDDFRQLPHRVYAMTDDFELFFFERIMGMVWQRTDHPEWSFDYIVNEENLNDLLENEGLCHIYTHLCQTSSDVRIAFYNENADSCWIKPEVEERFQLLNEYQQNRGLWIAPPEIIYDRLLTIDSVMVVDFSNSTTGVDVSLMNYSSSDISNFCFEIDDRIYHYNLFESKQVINIEYLDEEEVKEEIVSRSFQEGSKIRFFTSKTNYLINMVRLYNIKGELIKTSEYNHVGFRFLYLDAVGLNSGLYFAHIDLINEDNENFFKEVIKILYIR